MIMLYINMIYKGCCYMLKKKCFIAVAIASVMGFVCSVI